MNNKLIILHLNIQSIISESKKIQLQHLIETTNPDLISLNETFLKPKNAFKIPNFKIFRSDRLGRKGGGAAICVRDSLKGSVIDISNHLKHENGIGFE